MRNNAEIAEAERKSALRTIFRVVPYLWPRDRFDVRVRVILALLLLVVATVIALLISSQMVSRNSEAPGFLIQQWNMIITTIGADYADDIER